MEKPQIEDILPVEVINFPESEKVSGLLEDLIKKIEALDLVVNVKEQKIDIQEIVNSIKEIPQGKDYTQILEGISEKLNEEPEEEKEDPEKKEKLKVLKDIHKAIKEVNTTQDFTPILELLQLIALKEDPEPPFSFDNGRLLVTVDRVSSGGGGLKQSESEALIEIPTKQDELIGNKALRLAESGNYTYIGKADIGSLSSDPVWQIKRIDETSGLVISWADGDDLYDNIFDDYLTINFV